MITQNDHIKRFGLKQFDIVLVEKQFLISILVSYLTFYYYFLAEAIILRYCFYL